MLEAWPPEMTRRVRVVKLVTPPQLAVIKATG
jgi:hypothetical protein